MNSDKRTCTCGFDFRWLDDEWKQRLAGHTYVTGLKFRTYSNKSVVTHILRNEIGRHKQWE